MSILARSMVIVLAWCVASGGRWSAPLADDLAGPDPDSAWADRESEDEGDSREDDQDDLYDEGMDALDEKDWAEAARAFDKVIRDGGRRADGALYWMAYALSKQGRRAEALTALEKLRSSHPGSRWLDDARALELEIRQGSGQAISPESEDDDELKLMALNGLLNMDAERAVPMLEKILSGTGSTKFKEHALFVLVQTGSPRARETVAGIARGQKHPGMQRKAIEYLGAFGGHEASALLKEIYASSTDERIKKSVLNSYMVSGDTDALLAAATRENDESLRRDAIQLLGAQGAEEELMKMFRAERSVETKEQILQALGIGGDRESLLEVARTDKEPRLRVAAINGLGICGGGGTELLTLYRAEKDIEVRKAILNAFFLQGEARPLIDIYRKETDPELRKEAVEKLSLIGSKEATDFLLELLEK